MIFYLILEVERPIRNSHVRINRKVTTGWGAHTINIEQSEI